MQKSRVSAVGFSLCFSLPLSSSSEDKARWPIKPARGVSNFLVVESFILAETFIGASYYAFAFATGVKISKLSQVFERQRAIIAEYLEISSVSCDKVGVFDIGAIRCCFFV